MLHYIAATVIGGLFVAAISMGSWALGAWLFLVIDGSVPANSIMVACTGYMILCVFSTTAGLLYAFGSQFLKEVDSGD